MDEVMIRPRGDADRSYDDRSYTVPAGWYPSVNDPSGMLRYWDGATWTAHVTAPAVVDVRSEAVVDVREEEEPRYPAPASPWRRIAGRLIDIVFVGGTGTGIVLIPLVLLGSAGTPVVALLSAIAALGFEVVCLQQLGATPGKLLVGTAVIDRDGGTPIFWSTAIRRSSLQLLGQFPLLAVLPNGIASAFFISWLVIGVVSLALLFVGERRTVFDWVSGTRVVDWDDLSSSEE